MANKKMSLKIELDMETGQTFVDGPFEDELVYFGLLGLAMLSIIETRMKKGKSAEMKSKLELPNVFTMPFKKPS